MKRTTQTTTGGIEEGAFVPLKATAKTTTNATTSAVFNETILALLTALIELLKVKSIVTLSLVWAAVYLSISSRIAIPSEVFVAIVSSVVTYYFNRR